MRRKVIAIVLAACFLLAGVAVYWQMNYRTILSRVEPALADELGKALGTNIELSSIEITDWNSLVLHDLTIYDKQGREMLTGGTISVSVNVLDVLRGRAVVEALSDVNLTGTAVFLRRESSGRWNIEDFTEQTQEEETVFHGRILLKDAVVTVVNPERQWTVEGLRGNADFSQYPSIAVAFAGNQNKTTFQIEGTVNRKGHSGLEVIADHIVLEDYLSLMPAIDNAALTTGTVNQLSVFAQYENNSLVYAGEASLAGVAGNLGGFAVADATGRIAFTEKSVHLYHTTAYLAGQPLNLQGQIDLGGSEPVFNMTVSSPACDVQALSDQVPVKGLAAFQVQVAGTPSSPVLTGEAALPQGEVQGYTISEAKTHFRYSGQTLLLDDAQAVVFGGKVAVSGQVDIARQSLRLQAMGSQLQLGLLTGSVSTDSMNANGALDFQADISTAGAGYSELQVNGAAAVRSGQIAGLAVKEAYAGFSWRQGSLALDYLTADAGGGYVIAAGTVNNDGWNVTVRGQDLQLAELAGTGLTSGSDLAGNASFTGTVTGALAEPEFQGYFAAADGQVLYQPYQQLSGRLQLNRHSATILDGRLVNGVASHEVAGTIGLDGSRPVALKMVSRQVRAENLVKIFAPEEQLTGNVDNEVLISGSFDNLNAVGHVVLTDGSFRGHLISKIEGRYQRQDGVTRFENFTVNARELQAQAAGLIDAANRLDIAIQAHDIDLARLPFGATYPIAGKAGFNGRLQGPLSDPRLEGQLSADRLVLNSQIVETAAGEIGVSRGGIDIPSLTFQMGQGKVVVMGGLEWPANGINGSIIVDNGQLASILAMLNVKDPGVDGRLNGRIVINGTLDSPGLRITGSLINGNIKNYPLDKIDVDATLENNVLSLHQFMAKQGNGILAAQGTADLNGPLEMEIGGRNIDAGILQAWLNSSMETKGQLNISAQISGTAKSPYAAVSLDIANGGVGSATFDQLYGLFIYDKENIEISQLFLAKGPYRASAYGRVPLAALQADKDAKLSSTEQMDIKLRLDQADLRILPWLTKEVSWATGPMHGEVTIGGTLANPDFRGGINIAEGTAKLKALDDPIQKMVLDIQLEGDTIRLKSFAGQMGKGSFRLEGSMSLKNLVLGNYDLDLTLNHLALNHKYFRGPVNGSLRLLAANGKPLLRGKLEFENDMINIPALPEMTQSDLDIGLDVEAVTLPRVHFYNPYMYDIWAEGQVKITGSSQQPSVTGGLRAVRGTVSYLRTPFRVRYATVHFLREGSLEPTVKLAAETSLSQTKVYLNANGSLQQFDIRLTSEPAMNQQEILSLLTLRSRYAEQANTQGTMHDTGLSRDEAVGLMSTGLQMAFMNEMEASFRNVFGLDEFRFIEGASSDSLLWTGTNSSTNFNKQAYSVKIGKYLTDRLYLSYTRGVSSYEGNSVSFRYDLTRRISLTGTSDDQNRRWIGLEARYSF
ncbi:MAG: hypothetical protein H6Q65_1883 [Firmicutes bacterium]|nr:hypothetical protein [Bacillota bacterium]